MDNFPKVVAFVPARVSSKRFPKKHLSRIGHLTIIQWIAKRLKDSKYIDQMVLCLPREEGIEELESHGKESDFQTFMYNGNVNDVVGRLARAADYANAEICLLVSGDCPLVSTTLIDKLILSLCQEILKNTITNVASFEKREKRRHGLQGIKLATRGMWKLGDFLSTSSYDRENHFPIIDPRRKEIPCIQHLLLRGEDCDYLPEDVDLSINTPDQLETMQVVFETLDNCRRAFNYENVRDEFIKRTG